MKIEDAYYGSDYRHDVEIGLYELARYASARDRYEKLVAEKEEVFEAFYDDIAPSLSEFDYLTESLNFRSVHTDTKAIEIIEAKDLYLALMKKEKRKAELYEVAIKTLTHLELRVIQIKYHNQVDNLYLHADVTNQALEAAERKLCNCLATILKQRIKSMQKEKRSRLKAQLEK